VPKNDAGARRLARIPADSGSLSRDHGVKTSSPFKPPSRSGLPQLAPTCCDRRAAKVSHLHTVRSASRARGRRPKGQGHQHPSKPLHSQPPPFLIAATTRREVRADPVSPGRSQPMRASTTTDSPSPRRHHTKASIATLVAFCALAAGAQALAPASASAAISQPGACIPAEGAPLGWGKDSNGQDCLLKIEVIEVSGTAPPNAPSWLDQLEDCLRNPRCISGSEGSVPDLDGQHIDVVGWYRRLFRRKPPPMQPRPTLAPKPKAKRSLRSRPPLTPECAWLLKMARDRHQFYLEMGGRAPNSKGCQEVHVEGIRGLQGRQVPSGAFHAV
jgi:hypothetical protein